MRRSGKIGAFAVALAWTLFAFPDHGQAELDNLYQANEWFQFRDAMTKRPGAAPFYKGEFALAFCDWPEAEKQLAAAMRNRGNPAQTFDAALGLLELYGLSGRPKEARALLPKVEQAMQGLSAAGTIDAGARRQFEVLRGRTGAVERLFGYDNRGARKAAAILRGG